MTKDKARKSATRMEMARTGKPYALALRGVRTDDVVLCQPLATALMTLFREAGWLPVDSAERPVLTAEDGYEFALGPAEVLVHRERPSVDGELGMWGGGDPDDPGEFDLHVTPTVTVVCPPHEAVSPGEYDEFWVLGDLPPVEIVQQIRNGIAACRREALARQEPDVQCSTCRTLTPTGHLLWFAPERRYCAYCLFDEDRPSIKVSAADFAEFYDRMLEEQPVQPAAWTALAVLVANMAQHGPIAIRDLLDRPRPLSPVWEHVDWFWLWLPQSEQAPASLKRFGAGATLGAIISALDEEFPDLRDRYLARDLDESGWIEHPDPEEGEYRARIAAYWPTVVAYAVSFFLTATCEESPPPDDWAEVLDSPDLEALADNLGVPDGGSNAVFTAKGAWMLVEMIAPEFAAEHVDRRWL